MSARHVTKWLKIYSNEDNLNIFQKLHTKGQFFSCRCNPGVKQLKCTNIYKIVFIIALKYFWQTTKNQNTSTKISFSILKI